MKPPSLCVVWGMLPQVNFNFRLSEITSGTFSDKYDHKRYLLSRFDIARGHKNLVMGGKRKTVSRLHTLVKFQMY